MSSQEKILTTEDILKHELETINNRRSNGDVYSSLHDAYPRTALCLSGGGIRSAAFGLGIIQALAQHGLLKRFHYISTVSGGGYTGAWLFSWLKRKDSTNVLNGLISSGTKETPEIRHLRENTKYLTPRAGLLSPDTWAIAVIFFRNMLLNWLIFLPMLLFFLSIPRLMLYITKVEFTCSNSQCFGCQMPLFFPVPIWPALVLYGFSFLFMLTS
ncbi:patatin-like phospholipase family protein [Methylocystis parvus]|uniref:patatin-like phospholipase family protein n=1 Tax=Methylocystis parvus TaxID=134 RepID=UPI003C70CF0C